MLGKLTELVIDTKNGTKKYGRGELASTAYVAWLPKKKTLAVVFKRAKGNPGRLDDDTLKAHQLFHNCAPQRASVFEWPDQKGTLKPFGLLRSITYVVPKSTRSPEKNQYQWVHAFGDHGEEGHGEMTREKTYPDRYKPGIMLDADGNLFIVRRPGNKYFVSTWIYW